MVVILTTASLTKSAYTTARCRRRRFRRSTIRDDQPPHMIRNTKNTLRAIFLGTAIIALWAVFGLNDARAGTIIQRPLYFGLNQGLLGFWSFDAPDMAGNSAYDRSGSNNTGTLTNGPTRQIGKIGQALNFDGGNDQIVISSGPSVSTNATIAGWFYWQSGVASLIRDDRSGFGWILACEGSCPAGTIIFRVGNSKFNTGVNSASYLNKWTHYAVTKNGGAVVYYLNGIQVYASTGAGNTQNVLPWHIMMNGQNAQYIRGMTDDVRLYNRALSAEAIKRLYNMGATTKFNVSKKQDPSLNQGLVGLWTFDAPDMAGVTAYDRS